MIELFFNTWVVFFVVIDPLGTAAIFAGMTQGGTARYRRRMAVNATVLSAAILLFFFFAGDYLLRVLGISAPAFRIAGGVLLFFLAIDMIFARQSGLRSTTANEQQEAESKPDISVFPLAFPLIAGPGALTTVLLMASPAQPALVITTMMTAILGVLLLTLMLLLFSRQVMQLLGETGTNVVSRLLGLVLAALAVQYVLDGVAGAFALT